MSPGISAPVRRDCGLDRGDALLAWRVGVEDFFPPLRIDLLDTRFAGMIIGARATDLQVTDIAGTAHHIARRPGRARSSTGDFFKLNVQLESSGFVGQGGNETRLEPGAIVIYDFARPYDLVFEAETRFLVALFPKRALTARRGPRPALRSPSRGWAGPRGCGIPVAHAVWA
ncbi:hypothetical protein [Nocardia brevicatena]|uniref:AraC-like ligand-binding domain-containing protein n=1 Tax=Nocardia brevicatena TaxID=37327 RepID=UPI0012F8B7DE|nr:hypothetical protein [Nocardia brevicatena]